MPRILGVNVSEYEYRKYAKAVRKRKRLFEAYVERRKKCRRIKDWYKRRLCYDKAKRTYYPKLKSAINEEITELRSVMAKAADISVRMAIALKLERLKKMFLLFSALT